MNWLNGWTGGKIDDAGGNAGSDNGDGRVFRPGYSPANLERQIWNDVHQTTKHVVQKPAWPWGTHATVRALSDRMHASPEQTHVLINAATTHPRCVIGRSWRVQEPLKICNAARQLAYRRH